MKKFLTLALVSLLSVPAYAAEEAAKEVAGQPAPAPAGNPHILKAQEQAQAIAASFSEAEMRDLAQIRDAFGLVRSVQVVKRDVGRAVGQCVKANPDMKDFMQAGHESWDKAIAAAVDPRDKDIKAVIRDGRFSKPKQVEDFLATLDKAAVYAENKLDKRVVTSPEACTRLTKSMDETQKVIVEKMGEIKLPAPLPAKTEPSAGVAGEGKAAP